MIGYCDGMLSTNPCRRVHRYHNTANLFISGVLAIVPTFQAPWSFASHEARVHICLATLAKLNQRFD